ncbi:MAG: glycosyltransferase [Anaerolineales bacterium]|uniref:glycosyltransferase n=1 Tax=Candidatus Villigracilis vicinus TaxID=3140679 RepID=UPI00313653F5|nr:glycosyltransferase [Anaerolineales bacterium]
MKIAIVHEWLSAFGGSERLLAQLLRLFPHADVFALTYFPANFQNTELAQLRVQTTFMQKIPHIERHYRKLLPIMPFAIETLDVSEYDLVISLSHAVAHGVKTHKQQSHISYISTPMRYAWHMRDDYLKLHHLDKSIIRLAANGTLSLLRRWDTCASVRSDSLIANSAWTAGHIRKAWARDSQVIYPAVDVDRFTPAADRGNFYLLVCRLVPYKLAAEIVKTFNILKLPLVIVGDGPDLQKIQRLAEANVRVMGYQPDAVVTELMNHAKAFVYMATEDFGIAMVEAQAAGCPVIAYGIGGASEIVLDGETGLLFQEQTSHSLIEAVLQFQSMKLNSEAASINAARFSSERFRSEFSAHMDSVTKASTRRVPSQGRQTE